MGALFSVPTVTEAIASLPFLDSRWARVPICGWTPRPSQLRQPGGTNSVTPTRSLPAGEPRGHLLDDPQIAVGIVEGAERPVAGALRVRARLARLDGERGTVPDVAHVDAK